MLKHCAANRKRWVSALSNVGSYTTLKFLALQGAPYRYDISRLRVKHYHTQFQEVVVRSIPISDAVASVNGSVVAGWWQGNVMGTAWWQGNVMGTGCDSVFKTAGKQQGNDIVCVNPP
jgi:ABC-type transporter Mla maintaining outer membrane lipid asymmetry permease subunit MlaE